MANVSDIWTNPIVLAGYEFVVYLFIWHWPSKKSAPGTVMGVLTIGMIINNGIFVITGGYDLYRMSVVGLLFFLQCVFGIGLSYYTRYKRGKNNGGNGAWQHVLEKIQLAFAKMDR